MLPCKAVSLQTVLTLLLQHLDKKFVSALKRLTHKRLTQELPDSWTKPIETNALIVNIPLSAQALAETAVLANISGQLPTLAGRSLARSLLASCSIDIGDHLLQSHYNLMCGLHARRRTKSVMTHCGTCHNTAVQYYMDMASQQRQAVPIDPKCQMPAVTCLWQR